MLQGIATGFVLGGVVLGVFVLIGTGYYYFASGMAPVAVSDPLMPFERKMANMLLTRKLRSSTWEILPSPPTSPICSLEPMFTKRNAPCATVCQIIQWIMST